MGDQGDWISTQPYFYFQDGNSTLPSSSQLTPSLQTNSNTYVQTYATIRTVLCTLGIFPNCFVLLLIFKERHIRMLQYLNANLAIVCILAGILGATHGSGYVIGQYMCPGLSYLRNVSINTIALNVLCISHERCRRLKASCPGVPSLFQTITFIWGVGMAVAIPTYFTTTFVSHTHQDGEVHSTCCRGPMMGNYVLGIVYEFLRCSLLHIALSIYLLFELYKIRSKLKHLRRSSKSNLSTGLNKGSRSKTPSYSTIFLFINSFVFIFVWLPYGVVHSFYKNVEDKSKTQHFSSNSSSFSIATTTTTTTTSSLLEEPEKKAYFEEKLLYPPIYYVSISALYLYVMIMPMVTFCVHRDLMTSVRGLTARLPASNNGLHSCEVKELTGREEPTIAKSSTFQPSSMHNGEND